MDQNGWAKPACRFSWGGNGGMVGKGLGGAVPPVVLKPPVQIAVANSARSSRRSTSSNVRFFGRRWLAGVRVKGRPKRFSNHWPSHERSMTLLLHYGASPRGSRNLSSDKRFPELKGTITQTVFALARECKWNPVTIAKKFT